MTDERKDKERYFFKGQYYDNEKDFFRAVVCWPLEKLTEESFLKEWERLGKDVWIKKDFYKAVVCWPLEKLTEESFLKQWETLGKDVWINLVRNNCTEDVSNGAMASMLQNFFLHVFNKCIDVHEEGFKDE